MYKLIKSEKVERGFIKHCVDTAGGTEEFRYWGIRFAFVWPTDSSPAYFVGGGSEVFDEQMDPTTGEVIRIISEYEHQGFGLDTFFNKLTDEMISSIANEVYCSIEKEDFRRTFFDYLDSKKLRSISAQHPPLSDNFRLRIDRVVDFDRLGNLLIEKGSPLYGDVVGISAIDLKDSPEIKFFRLNALSMLIAGFSMYPTTKPLSFKTRLDLRGGGMGWMVK